jgi:hypothetical protein
MPNKEKIRNNDPSIHHPVEKIAQLERFKNMIHGNVLELFAGQGNLTRYYQQYADVTALDKRTTGDSFKNIHALLYHEQRYNVVDIDGYGYPAKLLSLAFELMEDTCLLMVTIPVPTEAHIINSWTEQFLLTWYGSTRPTLGNIVGHIVDEGTKKKKMPMLIDWKKLGKVWRIAFKVVDISPMTICKGDKS